MTALDRVETRVQRLWAPPPRLTVSEWADRYRVLAPESSAEPGPWSTARVPYLKEPMDAWTDPTIETLVIMASSQSAKTECGLNCLGRLMHLDPAPALWVAATLETARATSKDRIAPMIRYCPELRERAAGPKGRSGSATILHREFLNGHVTIAGSNAPAALSSRPIRYLFLDEVDRYPQNVGGEGDPIEIAIVRARTFPRRRKILMVSSPTLKGASRIDAWFEDSDQRQYWLPCPRCGDSFVPRWGHPSRQEWGCVRWEGNDPDSVYIQCPRCAGRIEDAERAAMVAAGQWRPSAPFTGIAGWHIWEFYAPWRGLRDFVKAYLDSESSQESRQVFANTVEGRVWEPPAEFLEPDSLLARCEPYPLDTMPEGVRVLTAAVDVQDSWLAVLLLGWGRGEECWVIDRADYTGATAWDEVAAWLAQPRRLAGGGAITPRCTLVDSGGHRTQEVYAFVRPRQAQGIYASVGREHGVKGQIVARSRLKTSGGVILYHTIDTHQAKVELYARFAQTELGPRAVHFPQGVDERFFAELTAERLEQKRDRHGLPYKAWVLPSNRRNEALDLFVYAFAALRRLAPTPAALTALLGG